MAVASRVMSNPLVSCLFRNAVAGVMIGWAVAGGMLVFNVGGVGGLVFGADPWWLPLGMMLAFFGLSFGSLAMGSAVMSLGRDDGGDAGRRRASEPLPPTGPVLAAPVRRANRS